MSEAPLETIGTVRGGRVEPVDDNWAGEVSIELSEAFAPDALAGLQEFSHVLIVTRFHLVDPAKEVRGARHPRGNEHWPKVGIFAQRAKDRPNHLGVSVCRVVAVSGRSLVVEGLDAVDGTPVVDLKPWVAQFGPRGEQFQPSWMDELMDRYWS